ncbi:MAG TPA: ABC transporter permease [Vicinamibacterales bacterium]|nr:ABC transporter permease [Vicinamibacterales bacterium]
MSDAPGREAAIYGAERGERFDRRGGARFATLLWGLPGLIWLALFLVVPVAVIVVVSFFTPTIFGFEETWTLDNYRTLFAENSQYLPTLVKVTRNAAITTAISLVIGYPVAYFLATQVKKQRVAIALFVVALAPFFTSAIIRTVAWMPTLSQQGAVNKILQRAGADPISALLFSDFAVVLVMTQIYVLFMVTPIFFQLAAIDRSALEAARDLGASGSRVFFHVVLPLTLPGVLIGSVFVFVLSMGDFATYRIIGGGKVGSIGVNIQNFITQLQFPAAAAQAVVLVLGMSFGSALLLRFARLRTEL